MAQFSVFETADGSLVVDCQADDHEDLPTRLVAPIIDEGVVRENYPRMNPTFDVLGRRMTLYPQGIGTIPTNELRHKVASLENHHYEIIGALDLLITGV